MSEPTSAPSVAPPRPGLLDPVPGERWHLVRSRIWTAVCIACAGIVLVPLFSILIYVISRGASGLSLAFFTHLPAPVGEPGGGMGNAVVGSLILIGLASLFGLPVGILAGVYLSEVGRRGKIANAVRFIADVMSGLPSITIGVFVYALMVVTMKRFSALAGGVALAIVMIPTITRTTEELLRLVPAHLREASLALGVPAWRTTIFVVLRTAAPGIATGVMLAVARISGETAPLIFTAFNNRFWSFAIDRPMASMPVQILSYATSPYKEWQDQAWTGALVLVMLILVLNLAARDRGSQHGSGPMIARPLVTKHAEVTPAPAAVAAGEHASEAPAKLATKIHVDKLNAYFGKFHAIHDITIDIPERQVTAVIGPSGCGKSTFLRCLNRMHEQTPGAYAKGIAQVDGVDIYAKDVDPVRLRRRVGMVFQKPNPFPTMSIRDNVLAGHKLNGTMPKNSDELVERSLKHVALWEEVKDKLDQSGMSLSGGQQQRLCIARVLAVEPEVVLLDEPCSALDPIATARIEELIEDLKKRYTLVLVTHSMQQAARVSDFTSFFYMGDLVEFDRTEVIFTNPKESRTEDYVTGKFG